MQSLAGRILFAITLSLAAARTSDDAPLPYEDMQVILTAYSWFGLVFFLMLAFTARRAKIEARAKV